MRDPDRSGYLLLNKKPGITSFESLEAVKKAFATSKVGHTGTLDKFASGLLLVLVGRAVKLAPWFSGSSKHYEGEICFGVETDTLDPEGLPVAEGKLPSSIEEIQAVLGSFRGDLMQAPPVYSAVHIKGKRASQLARSGKALEMQKRPVSVYALELRSYQPPHGIIQVHCSKGTYIRSLARDIARAAGSRGYLSALHRTQIAGFSVSQALAADAPPSELVQALRPMDTSSFETLGLPYFTVPEAMAARILHGKPLGNLLDEAYPGECQAAGVFGTSGEFLGILEKKAGSWHYGYVYARG